MAHSEQLRILLVDDEPNIVIAIEFLLEQKGYHVAKAYDGENALDQVSAFRPHLVLLDVMMPGLDGFEVARRIRHMDDTEDLKIVFLTAKGTSEDKLNGYAKGGDIYLTKPFDNDELLDVIAETFTYG